MIGGILIQSVALRTGLARYFDRRTFDRILELALDFLVVSAIASIMFEVFLVYFWPVSILMVVGLLWVLTCT